MERKEVILVTGLSGAGKTSSMAVLEDMGYNCIDRFPVSLIDELGQELISGHDLLNQRLALSVSAKDFYTFKTTFENLGCSIIVLFLDASYESLLLRYKYNRRNHPLLVSRVANSLEEAIKIEIDEFSEIKTEATIIIDTSFLTQQKLAAQIQKHFAMDTKPVLSISFLSFGYRYGLPRDADLVFDVRFLVNPYWDENLREMSGNDQPVFDYVINDEETQKLLDKLVSFLDYALLQYEKESKHHLTIAIGCTGGQHRSVSIANWLYDHYHHRYFVLKSHRDVSEKHD